MSAGWFAPTVLSWNHVPDLQAKKERNVMNDRNEMAWLSCARAWWCRAPDGENGTTGLLADLGRDVAGAFAAAHHEYGLALHGLGGLLVLVAVHHLPYTTRHTQHTPNKRTKESIGGEYEQKTLSRPAIGKKMGAHR